MKCSNCSAPLPAGNNRCVYCGALTDIDLSGKHYFTTHIPDKPRMCPGCGKKMQTINVGNESNPFLIERCDHCHGLFFDPGELDSYIDHSIRHVYTVESLALADLAKHAPTDKVQYRKCPVCAKLMNRNNFGDYSGVIIDRCREHGIYLDAGELKQILSWVRLGGERKAEILNEDKARQEALKKAAAKEFLGRRTDYDPKYEPAPDSMVAKVSDLLIKLFF